MKQFIGKVLGNIEWIITGLFFIFLPVIYSKKVLDPALYTRYFALSIWVLVISVVFIYKTLVGKFSFYLSKTDKWVFGAGLLFVLVNVVSAFGSVNYAEALFKTFKEFTFFIAFFYLYQMLRNNANGKNFIIKSVIIMAAVFLAIGIAQLLKADFTQFKSATSHYGYYLRQAIDGVKSTLASWNQFAYYLLLSLPFTIYGVIFYKMVWRWLSAVVGILSLGFIGLLASKGGWGGTALFVIVAVFILYLYLFYRYPKETNKIIPVWLKVALIVAPVVFVIGGGVLVKKADIQLVKVAVDKVQQVLSPELCLSDMYNVDNPTSGQTRTLVWAHTIQMAREHPVFGVGPGQWRISYAQYGLDGFEEDIRNGVKHFQRTHNDFLWILGETGFVGLFLYLFIYILVLVVAFRNTYKNKDLQNRILNLLIFSILIAFILPLFISFPRERVSLHLMLLLIMALALVTRANKNEMHDGNKKGKVIIIGSMIVVIGLGIFNLIIGKDMLDGDKASRAITYAGMKKNFQLMYRAANSLEGSYYTLDSFGTPIPYYKGVALSSLKKIEAAKVEFEKAYKLHPYCLPVIGNLATSYDKTGERAKAIELYKKSLKISPRFKESLVNMAIIEYNQNNLEAALNYIVQVPYGKKAPEQFDKVFKNICKRRAINLASKSDIDKLKAWLGDENKIKDTFVKFQKEKGDFDKILLQEIGK